MLKQINNYVFSSTNGTITFTDFETIELENIKSIVNVTRSQVLFNPLNPELLGSVANNVLTLDISTSGMNSNDDLAIMYETSDNFATNESQEDILEAVDGLEGMQITSNSLLTDIKAFFTNTYNQVTNWIAVKVINFPNSQSIPLNIEGGGKISVGTSAVEVTFTGQTREITITADKDNTGKIFYGKSNVTNAGANSMGILYAGDSISFDYDDSSNPIYVISDTASQNVWKGAILQ